VTITARVLPLDEIVSWKDEGVNVVVSLLEHHEVTGLELDQEPAERRTFCRESRCAPCPIGGWVRN
jgi:hypothetical protein